MLSFSDTSRELLTEQGNQLRLITKNRYTVEIINGRVKTRFEYFNRNIRNTPHCLVYLTILK